MDEGGGTKATSNYPRASQSAETTVAEMLGTLGTAFATWIAIWFALVGFVPRLESEPFAREAGVAVVYDGLVFGHVLSVLSLLVSAAVLAHRRFGPSLLKGALVAIAHFLIGALLLALSMKVAGLGLALAVGLFYFLGGWVWAVAWRWARDRR